MENILNISSQKSLEAVASSVISVISSQQIDYIYCEHNYRRGGIPQYFFEIKTNEKILGETVANCLAEWILNNFDSIFAANILKKDFAGFSQLEIAEILENTLNSITEEDRIYNKKLFVNNLTNYLNLYNNLCIEGFLRFRAREYQQRIEEYLFDVIDAFFANKEYIEFIELIKSYISESESFIDLLHVKINCDGSFSLYNFKKAEIAFVHDELYMYKNIFSEEDKLISVLLSVIPKRIIWHNNCKMQNINLINTLKEIFGDRFSQCHGCELCCTENL